MESFVYTHIKKYMHLKNDKIQSVRNIQFKVNLSANSNSQCYNFPLLRLSVNCLLYILPDIVYTYVYLQLNTCIYNIDGTLYTVINLLLY